MDLEWYGSVRSLPEKYRGLDRYARFGFETFLAFGNLIDPFIDRGFGPHFDAQSERDRGFIDRVHARDEAELQAGTITPTHMLAVLTTDRAVACRHRANLTPAFCIRNTA